MAYTLNPFTGNFDFWSNDFGTGGFYMTDPDGVRWLITIDTAGAFVISLAPVLPGVGEPMGLLLALTYSS